MDKNFKGKYAINVEEFERHLIRVLRYDWTLMANHVARHFPRKLCDEIVRLPAKEEAELDCHDLQWRDGIHLAISGALDDRHLELALANLPRAYRADLYRDDLYGCRGLGDQIRRYFLSLGLSECRHWDRYRVLCRLDAKYGWMNRDPPDFDDSFWKLNG